MRVFASRSPISLPIRFAAGLILILLLSLSAYYLLMNPAMNELGWMAALLSIIAVISSLAGAGAYRLGWMERSPTIRWALIGGYALSTVLTYASIWVMARLMFADQHDLQLASVLLIFSGGMAMAMGYLLSSALADRIHLLDQAAQAIAAGDLEVRVPEIGRDEMGALAQTFNQMAAQLQETARKQHELENLRRELIAWAGHDLQTPLASIRAIVEALADGVVDDAQTAQRYLNTAQRDIRDLSSLIDDLFEMAQLDAGGLPLNREYNSITDLISDTLESFSELAARQGVALAGSVADDIDPVYFDAMRIGRVLNNLLGNAIRHTPSGGCVRVLANRSLEKLVVEVEDTGEGIRPEDLPHVFDRFYRGEKSRSRMTGGAGLGLAIARGIVEAHGGQIGVESLPGKTRFTFALPAPRRF
jgi:signal transduction histidine kinase